MSDNVNYLEEDRKPSGSNHDESLGNWLEVYHAMLEDIEGETISQKINLLREMAGLKKWS